MAKEKKYKLSKTRKTGVAIGLASVLMLGSFVKLILPDTHETIDTAITPTYSLNIEEDDEYEEYDDSFNLIPINVSKAEITAFDAYLNSITNGFYYSDYFCVDETLDKYRTSELKQTTAESNVITNDKIDAIKLYKVVEQNNKKYMSGDKNSINIFYTDLSSSEIKYICDIITNVVNDSCTTEEIKKISNLFSRLKMFKSTTSSSNAYVSNDFTLVYNPDMSSMYSSALNIRGSEISEEEAKKSIIIHEAEHLIQYSTGDQNDTNGIEAGFCRKYNVPNKDKQVNVDSLYYTWLLEGSAEINMSEYMDIEPCNYAKKISYMESFDLSRIFKNNDTKLIDTVLLPNIDSVFQRLNMGDEASQKEFLELMYSIELTQTNGDSFFEYYQEQTGKTLNEDEKKELRMKIREDAIIDLSKTYYSGLASAINSGEINDLNTMFFMMRVWEIDAYSHLQYNKDEASLENAKKYINWSENVHSEIFEMIGNNINLSQDEVREMYNEYNLYVQSSSGQTTLNCNLDELSNDKKDFLISKVESYARTGFSRVSTMASYLSEQTTTK